MASDIVVSRVCKSFSGPAGRIEALGPLDLEVGQREFVSVLGPSGCGKSTLLRVIAGLIAPSDGQVELQGGAVRGPRRDIGIVFQSPRLLPWRTVLGNIELQLEVRGVGAAERRARALDLVRTVGLAGFESSYPSQLSGGMQQRVALCRSLIHEPSLLLMDEPFGALDAITREQMNLELQQLCIAMRKTVVLVTHSITEAVFLSDRVAIMSARPGRIVTIIAVDLPRPRTVNSMDAPEFLKAARLAREAMNLVDAAAPGPAGGGAARPIPAAMLGRERRRWTSG